LKHINRCVTTDGTEVYKYSLEVVMRGYSRLLIVNPWTVSGKELPKLTLWYIKKISEYKPNDAIAFIEDEIGSSYLSTSVKLRTV